MIDRQLQRTVAITITLIVILEITGLAYICFR